jgi:Calcineurin-like phosphoesterase.
MTTNNYDSLLMPKFSPVVYLPTKCCNRLIAIGDIHGCYDELQDLLQLVQPTKKDCLVFLGDLVDRGPFSDIVVQRVTELQEEFPYVYCVLGNHDEKHVRAEYHIQKAVADPNYKVPMHMGASFFQTHVQLIPSHLRWLAQLPAAIFLNDENPSKSRILTHAGLLPRWWLNQPTKGLIRNRYLSPQGTPMGYVRLEDDPWGQPPGSVLWQTLWTNPQRVIVGHIVIPHEPQFFEVINGCYSIDTGCVFGGRLTAYIEDLSTGVPTFVSVKAHQEYVASDRNKSEEMAEEILTT